MSSLPGGLGVTVADGDSQEVMVVKGAREICSVDWAADGKSLWVCVFSGHTRGFMERGIQAILNADPNGTNSLESDAVSFKWARGIGCLITDTCRAAARVKRRLISARESRSPGHSLPAAESTRCHSFPVNNIVTIIMMAASLCLDPARVQQ